MVKSSATLLPQMSRPTRDLSMKPEKGNMEGLEIKWEWLGALCGW